MSDILSEKSTPVVEKTIELCEALLAQDSYKELKGKLDAFVADPAAQEMYQNLSRKQSELVSKQQSGEELTEEDIQAFEDDRERLLMHPVAGGFVEAQRGFEELRDLITNYVTKTFELGRVPTEDEVKPQGGCCGGGGCGGGSCGTGGGCG